MAHPFFADRTVVLATMHRKERVIAPILEQALGVRIVVPEAFDTDQFGTFTRDRPRLGTQREAARRKAEAALELTGETLAIASEGSFGPHPAIPMIAGNCEVVLLLDKRHNLAIVGQELTTETNFRHQTVRSLAEAKEFATAIGFPAHGLVVMPTAATQNSDEIIKGVTDLAQLEAVVLHALARSPQGTLHLETDMRAHYNPTRMGVIQKATRNLVKAIHQSCPACQAPGFELVERLPGLPCEWCQQPTLLTKTAIYHCQLCGATEAKLFPDGVEWANPAQCPYCNP